MGLNKYLLFSPPNKCFSALEIVFTFSERILWASAMTLSLSSLDHKGEAARSLLVNF